MCELVSLCLVSCQLNNVFKYQLASMKTTQYCTWNLYYIHMHRYINAQWHLFKHHFVNFVDFIPVFSTPSTPPGFWCRTMRQHLLGAWHPWRPVSPKKIAGGSPLWEPQARNQSETKKMWKCQCFHVCRCFFHMIFLPIRSNNKNHFTTLKVVKSE